MSLLTLIQDAALELGFSSPNTVINNADLQVSQLLAQANRAGKELRNEYDWPQLTREYTFSLSNGTASYALPSDFERFVFCTVWDRTNHWEMLGPLPATDWQLRKSGILTSGPRTRWRFKGLSDTQFYLDPTPSSAIDAVFEYQSRNCIRPRTWVTGQVYTANSNTFYNGNYYTNSSAGTAGATPPTHTSSTASDGGIIWAYSSAVYERFIADTDISNINEDILTMEVKWRYLQSKDLPGWDVLKAESENACRRTSSNLRGAGIVNMNAGRWARGIPVPYIPESNFG